MVKYRCKLNGQRGRGRNIEAVTPAKAAVSFFEQYGIGRTSDNVVMVDSSGYQISTTYRAKKT